MCLNEGATLCDDRDWEHLKVRTPKTKATPELRKGLPSVLKGIRPFWLSDFRLETSRNVSGSLSMAFQQFMVAVMVASGRDTPASQGPCKPRSFLEPARELQVLVVLQPCLQPLWQTPVTFCPCFLPCRVSVVLFLCSLRSGKVACGAEVQAMPQRTALECAGNTVSLKHLE